MSVKIQPSTDFNCTVLAVAWDIVSTHHEISASAEECAEMVRRVAQILAGVIQPQKPAK
jgi:hypothetical protein